MDGVLYDNSGFAGIALTNLHMCLKSGDAFKVNVVLTCAHKHTHMHTEVCARTRPSGFTLQCVDWMEFKRCPG